MTIQRSYDNKIFVDEINDVDDDVELYNSEKAIAAQLQEEEEEEILKIRYIKNR